MNNQKGEVVLVVMAVMMGAMMVFGMVFMHGGHDHEKNSHVGMEQQQEQTNYADEHQVVK